MLSNVAGWSVAMTMLTAVWIWLYVRRGPSAALGGAMALSFMFPVWPELNIGGLPFSIHTCIAIVSLVGYAVHRDGKIWTPLTMLDVCIGLMVIVHVLSDSLADGFSAVLPFRAYGEWALPYVAGRFAVRDRDSLDAIAIWIPVVLLVLGIASCVEAVSSRINIFELVFGERPLEGFPRTASRLGFKRAYGTVLHPIFFGMLMYVLLPWLAMFASKERSIRWRIVAAISLVVTAAGITATVSRIPWLSMLAATAVLLSVWYRALRWPVGLSAAAAIAVIVIWPNQTADFLSRMTGGGDRQSFVEIDGKAVTYTSSRNRLLILPAYGDALRAARVTGYGSRRTNTFPPDIPYLQSERYSAERLKNVDNAYVLMALRFGWLGATAVFAMLLTGLGTAWQLWRSRPDQNVLAAMFAMFSVLIPALLMTWMSYDFGFAVLWSLGVLGGTSSVRSAARMDRRRFA